MFRTTYGSLFFIAAVFLVSACHKDTASSTTTSSTPPANVRGLFTGTMGTQSATLTLDQLGTSVSGGFATAHLSGNVLGIVNGKHVTLQLTPNPPTACRDGLTGKGEMDQDELDFNAISPPAIAESQFTSAAGDDILVSSGSACPAALVGHARFKRKTETTSVSVAGLSAP